MLDARVFFPAALLSLAACASAGIGGAPSCRDGEAKLVGSLDGVDQKADAVYLRGGFSQPGQPASADGVFGPAGASSVTGTVHLEWKGTIVKGGTAAVTKGSFTGLVDGTRYCTGPGSSVYVAEGEVQFRLAGVTRCEGGAPVTGTVLGCYDTGL